MASSRRHGGLVKELAGLTPDSRRIPEMAKRIEDVQADAQRVERKVFGAVARGEFEEARKDLNELARLTPHSRRVPDIAERIEEVLAEARRAEATALGSVARGEFGSAREHTKVLASLTPDSPRVPELEAEIDRTLEATRRAEQMVLAAVDRGEFKEARSYVVRELASVVPESPRVSEMNEIIDQLQAEAQRTERDVSRAIDQGEFEQARRHVERLAGLTPDSSRLSRIDERIDRTQATAARALQDVSEAIDRGEFEQARKHLKEVSTIIPDAHGMSELEGEIDLVQATTANAQKNALDAIGTALSAIEAGKLDARDRFVGVARGHVMELARLSPQSPRVSELEMQIDRAELTPAMVRIGGREAKARRSGQDAQSSSKDKTGADGFWIGKYEVTFAEYDRFATRTNRRKPDDGGWGRERRPVVNVTWKDAYDYTNWLSEELGSNYRLPTAAEWEHAARAGSPTEYPWGNDVGRNRANCKGCGSRWDNRGTAPVGSFRGNEWGLHDVAGNVCEWTCSSHSSGLESRRCASDLNLKEAVAAENAGSETLTKLIGFFESTVINVRVCRGGYWKHGPRKLLSVHGTHKQDHSSGTLGFRLARD